MGLGLGLGLTVRRRGGPAGLVTSGLLAEYRFDEGSGTTLKGYDGSGHNAALDGTLGLTGSFLPTWNSKGLVFNGSALVQLPTSIWGSTKTVMAWSGCGQTQCILDPDGTTKGLIFRSGSGQLMSGGDENGPTIESGIVPRGDNGWGLVCGSPAKLIFNGAEVPAYNTRGNIASMTATGAHLWVGFLQSSAYTLNAGCYYLLFYSTSLTAGQIAQNHSYVRGLLAARGVTLGDTVPARAFVAFNGDSITAGSSVTGYVTASMASLGTSYPYSNYGQGGQTLATIVGSSAARFDPLLAYYLTTPRIAVGFAGTNDILAGTSGATTYANHVTWGNARKSAGWDKVVLLTCLKRSAFTAGQETERAALNTALLADFPTNVTGKVYSGGSYADYLVDVASETNLSDPSNTTYFSDGTHPTTAGHAIIAADVKAALQQIGLT